MAPLATLAALLVASQGFLTWWAGQQRSAWRARDIDTKVPFAATLAAATATGTGLALFVHAHTGQVWQAAAAAVAAWLSVLCASTDAKSYLMPRDITIVASWIGLALAIPAFSVAGAVTFGLWTILLTALFLLRGLGLGMGDIRLLWAYGTTLSWWVGIEAMVYGFLAAQVLQALASLLAPVLGYGRIMPTRTPTQPDPETASQPAAGQVKGKRHLPLGPALAAGFLGAVIWAVLTGASACTSFFGYLSC